MGFWDFLNRDKSEDGVHKRMHGHLHLDDYSIMSLNNIGSTGTDLTGGILNEEYLIELSGTDAADCFDKMRRSDSKVKMCINAVTNPIKKANWDIEPADDSEEAVRHADLVRHAIFEGMDKRWRVLLHEILTFVTFGYSLFERTHKVVFDDPKFGTYVGFKNFGFRSQRTIERWHVDEDEQLKWVEQFAFGDAQRHEEIPAKFLTLFSLDREGSNFEGVSMLRPAFGAYLRKRTFLKLQAIGIEKFAVPTPKLTVPPGKESTDQFDSAIEVLRRYTSHQSNYITIPQGWELELINNVFDPAKVQIAIDSENTDIVHAFMANFLLLGQSGSGSYALSYDLSDFFLNGLEHMADLICEEFNEGPIRELVDLNFGKQAAYPKMVCSGITDKAGKEFSEILKNFIDSKVIVPDDRLEEAVRKRYKMPAVSEEGQRKEEAAAAPVAFAEKKKPITLES